MFLKVFLFFLCTMAMDIIHNDKMQQFEVKVDGQLAELQYRMRNGTLFFTHTWVPEAIEGRGIASALAKAALEHARENKIPIAVLCPFVAAYLKRHPEYLDLLDPEFNGPEKFS